MCLSLNGKYFASCALENTIIIFDCDNNFQKLITLFKNLNYISSICFSPDNKYFVSCFDKGTKIFDCNNNFQELYTLNTDNITSVCFSPDSEYLIARKYMGIIKLYDSDNNFEEINSKYDKFKAINDKFKAITEEFVSIFVLCSQFEQHDYLLK